MTQIIPLSVVEAEVYLKKHDRHYIEPAEKICAIGVAQVTQEMTPVKRIKGIKGSKWQMSLPSGKTIVRIQGAAILGRNAAGEACLAHIYVDGVSQGYSLLYGAVWRAFKALGYRIAVL